VIRDEVKPAVTGELWVRNDYGDLIRALLEMRPTSAEGFTAIAGLLGFTGSADRPARPQQHQVSGSAAQVPVEDADVTLGEAVGLGRWSRYILRRWHHIRRISGQRQWRRALLGLVAIALAWMVWRAHAVYGVESTGIALGTLALVGGALWWGFAGRPTTSVRQIGAVPRKRSPLEEVIPISAAREGPVRAGTAHRPPLFRPAEYTSVVRMMISEMSDSTSVDVPELVARIAAEGVALKVPRLAERKLMRRVEVIVDDGDWLWPLRDDLNQMVRTVGLVAWPGTVNVRYIVEPPLESSLVGSTSGVTLLGKGQPPDRHTRVLVVSDLGICDSERRAAVRESEWARFARTMNSRRCTWMLLFPYERARVPTSLQFIPVVEWDPRTTAGIVANILGRRAP